MPPNTLRTPLEKCLGDSFSVIANTKLKNKGVEETEYLFIKQLEMIRVCLECEKIHDANRTLLSQIIESYMAVLNDDNVVSIYFSVKIAVLLTNRAIYLINLFTKVQWRA